MQQWCTFYHEKQQFRCDKGTWHAHFYSKPPARPTPHFVEDILGLKARGADHDKKETLEDMIVEQPTIDSRDRTVTEATSIRKSKQSSKCKSRIKCPITVDERGPVRSKTKATASHRVPQREQHSQSARTDNSEVKRKKKARTTFTGRQIWELENTFKDKKYLTAAERNELAQLLMVTDNQVKIWFQNRRTKWKKFVMCMGEALSKNGNNNQESYEEKETKNNSRYRERSAAARIAADNENESSAGSGEDEND